jgi:hypothetical protein
MENTYTPEQVKTFPDFTDKFLCEIKDNIYQIKFLKFRVRDMESGFVLFEVSDEENQVDITNEGKNGLHKDEETNKEDESSRIIKYHLGPDFLELRNIGTALTFSVGPLPIKNLLMIERHYFKGKLIKTFEFKFDFCIPNSTNTWETIYDLPELSEEIKDEMIESPWETKSDSFYFVENKLIMHHKALYNYSDF